MEEAFETSISAQKAKKLFFNAEEDPETTSVFAALQAAKVPQRREVLPEQKPIDPFAHLKQREAELNRLRHDLATTIQDPRQVLIRGPAKGPDSLNVVDPDDPTLPAIVRQAAIRAQRLKTNVHG